MNESAHALAANETDADNAAQMDRVVDSAEYLAENLHRAPVLLIPCVTGRTDSIQVRARPSPTRANTVRCSPRFGVSCSPPGPGASAQRGRQFI